MCPTQRLRIRRQVAEMLGEKKGASSEIVMEVEDFELENELACSATCSWARSCWEGRVDWHHVDDMEEVDFRCKILYHPP